LLDGLARSSKVDQDGLAARSNKRMGTEKVKKEEVVQRTQLDNKSPIQVRHGEGIASHARPELCACGREAASEALIGECAGEVLSGARQVRGADVFRPTEGEMVRVVIARYGPALRRRRPWHAQKPSTWEPGDLHRCPRQSWPGPRREGRRP
jgi:hypothetical protein